MRNIFYSFLFIIFLLTGSVLIFSSVSAAATDQKLENCPSTPGVKCTNLDNPLKSKTTELTAIVGKIIQYALMVIGSLTLLMFVWGGFQWLTSAGNSEKIKKGSQTMIWAAIGVMLTLSSYIILTTYLDYLTGNS